MAGLDLYQALGLGERPRVALCGAGGKTTLLLVLAREAVTRGQRAAICTTTHIGYPLGDDIELFSRRDSRGCEAAWQRGHIVAAGQPADDIRLGPADQATLAWLDEEAEAIFVEADGAARRPAKYPAHYEPVIPAWTNKIIVVMGLSALDQPLDRVCHRHALARERLGLASPLVDEEALAGLILAYRDLRPQVVLNQADTPRLLERGRRVADLLAGEGMGGTLVLSLAIPAQIW